MTQQSLDLTFNLSHWLARHELDRPQELERALCEVPSEQRTLALLTWLHEGNLGGHKIHVPLS